MNNDRRDEIAAIFPMVQNVIAKIADIRGAIENVHSEENEAFEGMPEGLKNSDRGETAQAAIQALNEAMEAIDTIDLNDVIRALEEASDRSTNIDAPAAKLTKEQAEQRRWDRLPEWAVEHIARITTERLAVEGKMQAMFGDPVEGSMRPVIKDYSGTLDGKEIPSDRITFPQVGITLYIERERLCVHGEGMLTMQANGANTFYLRSERWG